MPCSTLGLDIGSPAEVISGSADDVSESLARDAKRRQWLPVDSCCPSALTVSPPAPPGGDPERIPLPDVNGSRMLLDTTTTTATTTSETSPSSESCFDLLSSSDGTSGQRPSNAVPRDCLSGTPPAGAGNRQRTKTRRKKAKSRDKTRNRKKKPQPEETSRKCKQAEACRPQTRAIQKAPPPVRGVAVTSVCATSSSAGSPAAPKTRLVRAASVQESGSFGNDSRVRLPRIARSRDDVAPPMPPSAAQLSLKKCASNPEISAKGGATDGTEQKLKRTTNATTTTATGHVISKEAASSQGDDGKKKPQVALLVAIKPENQESEREKFFKQRYNYNPQFTYRYPANPAVLERYSHPSNSLLPVAEKIMNHAINKYGSFEKFVETTGGKKLNRSQIVESAKKYLKKEGMLDEVSVRLSDDILSRACMTRFRGQPTLQVRTNEIREFWMEGLLRHELGTHYIRSSNNRNQEWYKWRRRRELNLRPFNPTEEGIAALHSIISRPEPSLFRSALLYYTAFKASELSFSQLFKDLGKFVKDPHVRWDYCMRAKRGQTDTAEPGTFSKDQVYLTGALSILKHRSQIDFHTLFRCGKVDFRDVDRLKDLAELQNTRIPGFMVDLDRYRRSLDEIVIRNGLTDSDLEAAV